jgi:hypothetical protein
MEENQSETSFSTLGCPCSVAFIPLGSDVLSMEFRAPGADAFQRDVGAFLEMLESYQDAR